MCDNVDDFNGNFDSEFVEDSVNDDSSEDHLDDIMDENEMEIPIEEEPLSDNGLNRNDNRCDGFDLEDVLLLGGFIGGAYEEGRRERRKKRKVRSDDSDKID